MLEAFVEKTAKMLQSYSVYGILFEKYRRGGVKSRDAVF